jgi:hypothetical protein
MRRVAKGKRVNGFGEALFVQQVGALKLMCAEIFHGCGPIRSFGTRFQLVQ